nr:WYL domain-containing protein [uncultured Campylobacter sp.]
MCQNADGSVEIELEITHPVEIKPLVFYYLLRIRVMEPKELADDINAVMREYLSGI